jgi:hypothetical protein
MIVSLIALYNLRSTQKNKDIEILNNIHHRLDDVHHKLDFTYGKFKNIDQDVKSTLAALKK